jgi:hypothetical protein
VRSLIPESLAPTRRDRVLRVACVMALVGLAFMVWSVLQPTWMPVMLGLTLGQLIGTLSFASYLVVLIADLGIRRRLREHEERRAREQAGNASK